MQNCDKEVWRFHPTSRFCQFALKDKIPISSTTEKQKGKPKLWQKQQTTQKNLHPKMQTSMEWWKRENQNMGEKRLTMVLSKSETIIKRGVPLNSIAGLSPFKVFLLLSVSKLWKTKGLLNLHTPKKHKSENFATTTTCHKDRESLMEGRKRIPRPWQERMQDYWKIAIKFLHANHKI